MTIYAGDFDNKKLIIVSKELDSPLYIDLENLPYCGALIKSDTELIIGCYSYLYKYSLSTPTNP